MNLTEFSWLPKIQYTSLAQNDVTNPLLAQNLSRALNRFVMEVPLPMWNLVIQVLIPGAHHTNRSQARKRGILHTHLDPLTQPK